MQSIKIAGVGAALVLGAACVPAKSTNSKSIVERKMETIAAMQARGAFLPPPVDGAKLQTAAVDLVLPRGCAPLDPAGMASTAAVVDDVDSELLAACNIVVPVPKVEDAVETDSPRGVKVTLVLLRHFVQIETGETATAALLRSPFVLSATTTTTTPVPGATVGPEVVLTLNAPSGPNARPSTALWYGALDGLYVLYAEVDADASSIAAWGDALVAALQPTAASHPIRWRAPTGIAPSKSAFGPYRIQLPEKVSVVSKTLDDVVDTKDPLDPHDARSFATFRDESFFAFAGSAYLVKLLPPIASTPTQLARISADARGVTIASSTTVPSALGEISRVDGDNARGDHEIFAAFTSDSGEATVLHFVIAQSKWSSYAPFMDASLATLSHAPADPY